jgi:phosphopantetheinyl transferase
VTQADVSTIRLTFARLARRERPQWLVRSAAVLDAAELRRVAAISDPDTRAQHAVGRALVRVVGAQACGCAPADVRVAVTDGGGPVLPELPGLHVNVSHTQGAVVVASACGAPVGVDIEQPVATVPEPRRLAQRLFSTAERRTARELSQDVLPDWFASVWTIKEAVGKALGVGIIPALSQVVVETGDGDSVSGDTDLRLGAVGLGPPAESWTLHQLIAPGGREKIAVAVPTPGVGLAPPAVIDLGGFARALDAHGATARRCSGSARRRAPR